MPNNRQDTSRPLYLEQWETIHENGAYRLEPSGRSVDRWAILFKGEPIGSARNLDVAKAFVKNHARKRQQGT